MERRKLFTLLELLHTRPGAVLILLSRPAPNPAGAYKYAAAEYRHGTLAKKHVTTLGHDDAAQRGMVGARREFAARTAEGGRPPGLALAAVGTGPHSAVHALKRHQSTASVAHGYVHLCADLGCLGDGAGNHAVRISECQGHARYSLSMVPKSCRRARA